MRFFLPFLCLFLSFFSCKNANKSTSNTKTAIDTKVENLLSTMSLQEKIGQLNLRGTSSRDKGNLSESLIQKVKSGSIGAFLNVSNLEFIDELQRLAVEESPHGIPLIFARDVIHGYKTIFPIPLGQAASWDTTVAYNAARASAIEATSQGIRWTFAPMLDICRDSRWGRIAESPGEDPYLASQIAKAAVHGYQGAGLHDPTSLAACAKHFVGYGAAEGGRDYNTTMIPEPLLWNVYLPSFEAAIEAGAPTVMTAFNEVNGQPASGSSFLLDKILRKGLGFDGFVVSDWESVTEMIAHGYAADEKHAAELAFNAGMDMEMTSDTYEAHVAALLEEGKITMEQLDFLVANILRVKFQMNLFENPYRRKTKERDFYSEEHLAQAKDAAIKSSVLLKNKNILPLKKNQKITLLGPLMHAPHEQLGTWTFDGEKAHTITPKMAFETAKVPHTAHSILSFSRDKSKKQFALAKAAARASDVVIFAAGEEAILSGEAHSRADIRLPGVQEDLIRAIATTGTPIVLVIMAGRPIDISNIIDEVDAVLMTWHPGTMGGPAILEMLYGVAEPQGRLPVTWPKSGAQLPFYYNHKNTGRPADKESFVQMEDIPIAAWQSSLGNTSHYLDLGFEPLFPFGYGLGYGKIEYSGLRILDTILTKDKRLQVEVTATNTSDRPTSDIAQLYIQDVVGSITRPVKELKGFQHIDLAPKAAQRIRFSIQPEALSFYNFESKKVLEAGKFNVWVGANSADGEKATFVLKD